MKTTKLIFALSLALIFAAGFNTMYAQHNLRTVSQVENKARMVTYIVRVENLNYVKNLGGNFLIMMTDETGSQVANAQSFRPGVSDYIFVEGGTVRGTRVAKMVKLPLGTKSTDIFSTSQTGIFYGGSSYLFVIRPIPSATDTGADID